MRILLFFVVSASFSFFIWYGYSTIVSDDLVGKLPVSVQDEKIVINGVRVMEKKGNATVMELVAKRSLMSLDETKTELELFTLVSHTAGGGTITITAENGIMENESKNVTAFGNVLARDSLGRSAATDSVKWINSDRQLVTDDIVRIYSDRFVITGKGMVAKFDENNSGERVELLSDVKATFLPNE